MKIKKGELFLFSTGGYDYEAITFCKANSDLDIMSLREEYLSENLEEREDYAFDPDGFVKWIITDKNLAQAITYKEWNLGDYGKADFKLHNWELEE